MRRAALVLSALLGVGMSLAWAMGTPPSSLLYVLRSSLRLLVVI